MELSIKEFNLLIATVIALSFATQLGAYFFQYSGIGLWLLFATLWVPVIACLLNGDTARRIMRRSLTSLSLKWTLLGLLSGLLLLGAEQAVLYLWDLGQLNVQAYYFDITAKEVSPYGVALLLGNDPQGYLLFTINIMLTMVIAGMLASLIFVVGFEACWRGVLYRQLAALMGIHKAPIFIGLLIGICFIPLHVTGYYNVESPYLTAFVYFPLICIGVSYVMAGLAVDNISVWPTAIALGVYIAGSGNLFLVAENAGSSLEAKAIVLTIVSLWVRSALISRYQDNEAMQQESLMNAEPLLLPFKTS
ncbi:hypothetical protein LZP73_12970 [Shewanella sp. AS16]|uniref:hypothetical protein n=1 Tax=Shewanella sp. AS16 TaxID=2907625 RepID=UPI001F46E0D3|nr:hypothetical protein [Shewanella sp. AS16]MCE9687103.1 hypothetical protein [Shewanella sp. AS16]